jgi:Tol biopolymer transport system component
MRRALIVWSIACLGGACADGGGREGGGEPAGSSVEIVGEGVISTSSNQTFPMEDPATGDLWFSSFEGSFDQQTILVARRTENGWAAPQVAPFSGRWGDRAPRFSPDGSYMLITSNRPRPGSEEAGDMDIWRLERTEDGWAGPELVPSPMSSPALDMHPSVTGSAVWVASRREGGLGRSDLYRIGFDGTVTHPGPPLNDELSQSDVWVSPDETWMIVVITDRPDGYGGDDLFVSRRVGDTWSAPFNLGPEINTPEYEYGPSVSADGEYLLFTSHRDGPSHVYRVPIGRVRDVLGM